MPKGDREILKADTEDGYTPLANLILEALAMAKMSGVQKGICMFLFRRTYGWGIKEDAITLREFAEAVDSSITYVSKQLKQLIEWKVIIRTNYEPGKTPTYTFNTRVAQWDKGCLNVQGLNEKTKQGLYKCARVGLSICSRVEQDQSLDTPESTDTLNKDINKDLNKSTSTYVDEQAHQNYPIPKNKSKDPKPKYSEDAKTVAKHLREKLENSGVTVFPRDWYLKEYAVAQRLLKNSSLDELKSCIDWLFSHEYWHDKTDSLLVVERQLPKYQLQKGGNDNVRGAPGNKRNTCQDDENQPDVTKDKLFTRGLD